MIKRKRLDVVRGGIAIPLPNKANYYYMSGRKHINGGIDLGRDPRTGLEVEDGEVVKVGKNDIKVYSSVPFLNGKSPAERVMNGDNANKVFNAQEYFKDKNGLNDDGTNTKKLGGDISGLYSITSNGETRLRPFPSTGSLTQNRRKADLGTAIKSRLINMGRAAIGIDDDNAIVRDGTGKLKYDKPVRIKDLKKKYGKLNYNGLSYDPITNSYTYNHGLQTGVAPAPSRIGKPNIAKIQQGIKQSKNIINQVRNANNVINAKNAATVTRKAKELNDANAARTRIVMDFVKRGEEYAIKPIKTFTSRGSVPEIVTNVRRNGNNAKIIAGAAANRVQQIGRSVGKAAKSASIKMNDALYNNMNTIAGSAIGVAVPTMGYAGYEVYNTYKDIAKQQSASAKQQSASAKQQSASAKNTNTISNTNANKPTNKTTNIVNNTNANKLTNIIKPLNVSDIPNRKDTTFDNSDYNVKFVNKIPHITLNDISYDGGDENMPRNTYEYLRELNNNIIKKYGGRKKAVLGTINNTDDNETYPIRPEYKRLYDKFNVKSLNRKFDKDYFTLLNKLKANENLTVADIYNGGEGTDDVDIRNILGENSHYNDIYNTDKENKLYDYYLKKYPDNINGNNEEPMARAARKRAGLLNNDKTIEGKTLPETTVFPQKDKDDKSTDEKVDDNNDKNRLFNSIVGGYVGDAMGLVSNIGGNIASSIINNRMLSKLKAPSRPVSQIANKLRTNYNINSQLDNLRETAARYEDAVNNNTTSSRVALARNQQNRFATALNTNNLYGTKENEETKLINADRLNQQEIANKNITAYNAWRDNVTNFKNTIAEKKAENAVAVTQGISGALSDTIGNIQNRVKDEKTILANALAHPNLPIEQFYKMGLITKKTMDSYREAHPING